MHGEGEIQCGEGIWMGKSYKFKLSKWMRDGGRMSDNLRILGGGGGVPAIPILKSVIGTAATQKRPSVAGTLLFSAAYLPICKTPNQ